MPVALSALGAFRTNNTSSNNSNNGSGKKLTDSNNASTSSGKHQQSSAMSGTSHHLNPIYIRNQGLSNLASTQQRQQQQQQKAPLVVVSGSSTSTSSNSTTTGAPYGTSFSKLKSFFINPSSQQTSSNSQQHQPQLNSPTSNFKNSRNFFTSSNSLTGSAKTTTTTTAASTTTASNEKHHFRTLPTRKMNHNHFLQQQMKENAKEHGNKEAKQDSSSLSKLKLVSHFASAPSSSSGNSSNANSESDNDSVINAQANSITTSTISSASSEIHMADSEKDSGGGGGTSSANSSIKLTSGNNINNNGGNLLTVPTTTTASSSSSSPSCSSPNSNRSQMPFKIRSSKYRHVYGNPHKEDVCYKNIKITKNAAHDSAFCAVNPKFVAIVTEECGGGAFIVIPVRQTGRIDINMPKVTGHRGPVLDLKWNPFNDNEIASCSEDTTIKVWQIGDHGLYENLNEWVVDLHGHQRKVGQIEWHPTAENIMISSSADLQVILWNLEKAEPIRIISCHNDTIQSMIWNRDGSFFATTCKDKKIRIIDPRSGKVINEGDGHQGSKISKVVVLGCGTRLFTTGFSKLSERQIALWNINDLSKPIQMDVVDCSSGILIPYYDYDTNIVFIAGKGDGNIRYYEITDSEPYIHYLSEYKSSSPQRGLGWMPKRGLDVTKNEIYRFYKLHATGGICEPISMIVPRKSEVFQEDIYPDTMSGIPSMSCEEWISGVNKEPILMSLKDGAVPFMPKIITYKQLGFSELGTNLSRSYGVKTNGNHAKTPKMNMDGSTSVAHHHLNGVVSCYQENNSLDSLDSVTTVVQANKSKHYNQSQHNPWSAATTTTTTTTTTTSSSHHNHTNDSSACIPGLDIHHAQPYHPTNNKLILSSKSAFNKMSSSPSYSSSPMSSPSQSAKYARLINTETLTETVKPQKHHHHHHHQSKSSSSTTDGHQSASNLNSDDNSSVDDTATTKTTLTTASVNNNHSSNESMNQSNDECSLVFKATNIELVSNKINLLGCGGQLQQCTGAAAGANNNVNDELEATYVTSMSKNPITLRKTESLKLDSVQSIRNRFDRINTSTLSSLSRNPQLASRHKDRLNSLNSSKDSSFLNERETNSHGHVTGNTGTMVVDVSSSSSVYSNTPPSPPTLILSPMFNGDKQNTPVPLLINTSLMHHHHQQQQQHHNTLGGNNINNSSSSSSSSSCNGNNNLVNVSHHLNSTQQQTPNTSYLSNGGSVIKKRVWTPVQSSSSFSKSNDLNASQNNYSELQKSYFRLLEEKNNLKEQLNIQEKKNKRLEEEMLLKDKRILTLENKLNLLMIDSSRIDGSIDTTDC